MPPSGEPIWVPENCRPGPTGSHHGGGGRVFCWMPKNKPPPWRETSLKRPDDRGPISKETESVRGCVPLWITYLASSAMPSGEPIWVPVENSLSSGLTGSHQGDVSHAVGAGSTQVSPQEKIWAWLKPAS